MITTIAISVIAAAGCIQTYYLKHLIRLTKRMYKFIPKCNERLILPLTHFPSKIFFAQESCAILDVKKMNLDQAGGYNGSIVSNSKGEKLLFYRVDYIHKHFPLNSKIFCVPLSDELEPLGSSFEVSQKLANSAEDGRFFLYRDEIYCFYNEVCSTDSRSISVARYDENNKELIPTQRKLFNLQLLEKNWTPIETRSSKSLLSFFYKLSPVSCLELDLDQHKASIPFNNEQREIPRLLLDWEEKFGTIRGGTPAIDMDEMFLTFFHSSFRNDQDGKLWYVMGACTLSKEFPHKVLSMSEKPIAFQSIYNTPITNPLGLRKYVVFPAGLIREVKGREDHLYLSLGENDSSVKILTLDTQLLLNELKPV